MIYISAACGFFDLIIFLRLLLVMFLSQKPDFCH